MKYLKLYENFREMTREEMFGKQTPLEKQFSEVIVPGLCDDNNEIALFWSTFNALIIEIENFVDKEDTLYKEMMYRIVDDQDPVEVMENIVSRIGETSPEMERLLTKMSEINPYKYKEQTYSDDDEQMEM
jgi:hypothetical protein